jgi:hypothetical protein
MDTLLRMQTAYDIAAARDREGDIQVKRYVAKPSADPREGLAPSGKVPSRAGRQESHGP